VAFRNESFPVVIVPAAQRLHGVSIDIDGDRFAKGVADADGARVV